MCGILGFLDKRGRPEYPVGQTLYGMLQALSCRGPDSAGVAGFLPKKGLPFFPIKWPGEPTPAKTAPGLFEKPPGAGGGFPPQNFWPFFTVGEGKSARRVA